jgi:glycosyltransferase involved in cell wall biosynthesis
MKILFVAMSDAVHAAKWIGQLNGTGWKLYFFPAYDDINIHEKLPENVIVCIPFYRLYRWLNKIGLGKWFRVIYYYFKLFNQKTNPGYYPKRLARTIRRIKPDLLHTLETQGAGYLGEEVRRQIGEKKGEWPKWWHTNWGSDIYLFGRLPEHKPRIEAVLAACNYYSCECQRDVKLAREFGFKGEVFPVYPNSGGFSPAFLNALRKDVVVPSKRKTILLKGYQGWFGRALVGIHALGKCADLLNGYRLVIYTNIKTVEVEIAATLLAQSTGTELVLLPVGTRNDEILNYQGTARISIGLSICDAISTAVLEAMAMGAFPIQSDTSGAGEWITDGETGFIVPPEDPEIIAQAIRKALTNDDLVDSAAVVNYEKILRDADYEKLKDLTIQSYEKCLAKA